MSDLAKYAFDTVFDEDGNVVAAPPPRPKTHFKQDDVDQALAQGIAQGQANAEAQAAHAAAAALQGITEQMTALLGTLNTERDRLHADAARLSFETAKTLSAGLIDQDTDKAVTDLIVTCLDGLKGTPHVTIRVASTVHDRLVPQIETLGRTTGFTGQIRLEADNALTGADCTLDWIDGGASFSLTDRLQMIERTIADYLQSSGETQLDLFSTQSQEG